MKEIGYGERDSLKVEDVCKFDQYHYFGTEAVDEAIKMLDISSNSNICDLGSGLGGPARYMSHATGCCVCAVEIQSDLNDAANDLSERCGLGKKLTHVCQDFLKADIGTDAFNILVSWLTILHFPGDARPSLFQKCFQVLKPGGKMYIEDFFLLGELTEQERNDLKEAVFVSYLPTKSEFQKHIEDAGFVDVQFDDVTKPWTGFVCDRYEQFCQRRERNIRVLGEATTDGLEYFYSKVSSLFKSGHLGGCRVTATNPAA